MWPTPRDLIPVVAAVPTTSTRVPISVPNAEVGDQILIYVVYVGSSITVSIPTVPSGVNAPVNQGQVAGNSNTNNATARMHLFTTSVTSAGTKNFEIGFSNTISQIGVAAQVVSGSPILAASPNPVSLIDNSADAQHTIPSVNISENDQTVITSLLDVGPITSEDIGLPPFMYRTGGLSTLLATNPGGLAVFARKAPPSGSSVAGAAPLTYPQRDTFPGVGFSVSFRSPNPEAPSKISPAGIPSRAAVSAPQVPPSGAPYLRGQTVFKFVPSAQSDSITLPDVKAGDLLVLASLRNNAVASSTIVNLSGSDISNIVRRWSINSTTNQSTYEDVWTCVADTDGPKTLTFTQNSGNMTNNLLVGSVITNTPVYTNSRRESSSQPDNVQTLANVAHRSAYSVGFFFNNSYSSHPTPYTYPASIFKTDDQFFPISGAVAGMQFSTAVHYPGAPVTTNFGTATFPRNKGISAATYSIQLAIDGPGQVVQVRPNGIARTAAFGTHQLNLGAGAVGLQPSGWTVQPTGFGQTRIVSKSGAAPPGTASVAAVGYPAVTSTSRITPSGRASTLVFPSPKVYAKAADTQTISAVRIPRGAETWGGSQVSAYAAISPLGLPRTAVFGAASSVVEKRSINAALIVPRNVEFGTARLRDPSLTKEITPTGIARRTTVFGTTELSRPPDTYFGPEGFRSYTQWGLAALVDPTIRVRTTIPRRTAVGRPTLGPAGAIAPQGIVARSVISAPAARSTSSTIDRITNFVVPRGRAVRKALPETGGTKYLVVDAISRQVQCELTLTGVSYGFEQNQAGGFEGSISLYDHRVQFLAPQRSFIVVERGGRPFWVGFLWQLSRQGKQLQIAAQEIWSIFGNRKVRDSLRFLSLDRAAAINFLVSYAQRGLQGDLGIDPTVDPAALTGDTFSWIVNWFDRKTVKEVADTIVSVDPFIFRFEPYWTANSKLDFRLIIDPEYPKPSKHSLIYESNVDDYSWATATPSPNFIDAFGAGEGEAQLRTTSYYSPASSAFIRIEGEVANEKISKRSVLSRLATSELRRVGGIQDLQGVTMSAAADPVLGTLMPGMKVRGVVSDGGIQVDEDFVINTINVVVPDDSQGIPGTETVEIGFGQLPSDTDEYEEGFLFKDNPGVLGIDITGKPTGYAENPILCNCQHPSHGKPYT